MAQVQYSHLFDIQVQNDFYQSPGDGKKDIALAPTAETIALMKTNTLLFRDTDQSSVVLYRTIDNAGTPLFNFGGFNLVYSIQLLNLNEFLNFTQLTGYSAGKIIYFTNRGTETSKPLTYSVVDFLKPAVFTYNFPLTQTAHDSSDRGHIQIKNAQNADVTPSQPDPNTIAPDSSLNLSYPIDFRSLPKGLYTFNTWTTYYPTVVSQTVYIDTDLAKQNVFGVVDINVIDYMHFPTTDRTYTMNFTRRLTQWNYYLVLKSGTTKVGDTIAINDSAYDPLLPYPPMTFLRQTDTVINGIDTAFFTGGQNNVPFYELPKKGLDVITNSVTTSHDISGPSLGLVSGTATVTDIFVVI